jgi:hypothetical protein
MGIWTERRDKVFKAPVQFKDQQIILKGRNAFCPRTMKKRDVIVILPAFFVIMFAVNSAALHSSVTALFSGYISAAGRCMAQLSLY